jgi:predicted tellurium resistance membrane protein TerC
MFDLFHALTLDTVVSFVALTFLEVVLGVDNIVFVALATERLPEASRARGRQLGLWLAMGLRVFLLMSVVWVTRLDVRLFDLPNGPFTIKDLVLSAGGLFLLYKGAAEIHEEIEGPKEETKSSDKANSVPGQFWNVVAQIGLINIVFSLDSIITAIGMASDINVMVAAVIVSTLLMMLAAEPVAAFIARRPTAKILALAFIILVGMALVAEGTGFHLPRGYLYFAMGFSLCVEVLNSIRRRSRHSS